MQAKKKKRASCKKNYTEDIAREPGSFEKVLAIWINAFRAYFIFMANTVNFSLFKKKTLLNLKDWFVL